MGLKMKRWARTLYTILAAITIVASSLSAGLRNSTEPPVIPVGLDAYRMWDQWPVLRIGQRAYMTSTYDRKGGNESADASHFLCQLKDDRNVSLDIMGQGVVEFARYNHWHGSPWHYIVDGQDNVVRETSSTDPEHPVENSVFIPEKQFPNPLTWTWSQTKGADLMWVPLPFEQSFTMAYERTHYGTGYYIYHKFMPGMTNLSRPIKAWKPEDIPAQDVLDLLNRSGADIAPKGIPTLCGSVSPQAGEIKVIASGIRAPSDIRAIKFSVSLDRAEAFSKARLLIYWDGSPTPSVDAPVNLAVYDALLGEEVAHVA